MCSEHYKNIKEIWGDVIGYEHLYRVSTLNQIKSLRFGKEKILKPSKYDKYGHLGVSLWKNKEPKFFRVHQLVMETFIGPCPIGMEICHNDGNPANNNLDNLRYDTPKNNNNDKIKHGTLLYGQKCPWAKIDNKQAMEIKALAQEGRLTQKAIGKLYNIDTSMVSCIKTGRRWKYLRE